MNERQSKRRPGALVLVCSAMLIVSACGKKSPSPSTGMASSSPSAAVHPVDLPSDATVCEVEMSGRVGQVVSGNRAIIVYTGVDDCMAPQARILDRTEALGDGEFFAEVFVPCGTKLSLCATIEKKVNPDARSLPTTRYGKLHETLLAEGVGEIEFANLGIALKDGPERTFPTARKAMDRPADRPMRADHPQRTR